MYGCTTDRDSLQPPGRQASAAPSFLLALGASLRSNRPLALSILSILACCLALSGVLKSSLPSFISRISGCAQCGPTNSSGARARGGVSLVRVSVGCGLGWVGLHCCEHVLLALVDDRRTEACAEAERSGGAASAAMELDGCGGASWSRWCSIPVSQRPSSQRLQRVPESDATSWHAATARVLRRLELGGGYGGYGGRQSVSLQANA